jgi:hypothetical protein
MPGWLRKRLVGSRCQITPEVLCARREATRSLAATTEGSETMPRLAYTTDHQGIREYAVADRPPHPDGPARVAPAHHLRAGQEHGDHPRAPNALELLGG